MTQHTPTIRIGVYGTDNTPRNERHGGGLWPAGYSAVLTAVEAVPVSLGETISDRYWDEILDGLHGVLLVGTDPARRLRQVDGEKLCEWSQEHRLPLLAVDNGLLLMNTTFGGTVFSDLPREQPEALQHRHPPEKGLRHALNVVGGTHLADIYGEGEVVVNSEHRGAVDRVARGFRVCARALDGVVEAIEAETDDWFALGVQWQPASSTASGLDIQLFRGLVTACERRLAETPGVVCAA